MMNSVNPGQLLASSSWKQQFKEAVTLQTDDEDGPVSIGGKIMHWLTLPWKLLFALVPPTDYLGGWACFVVSILMIGLVTAMIGDLAGHFGCTVGLKASVTAITLVAVGTSLPDTFASKGAAINDDTADSSISNVTGSNAVNVYLGIGIAWMIAAIYHTAKGSAFKVDPGTLGFSLTIYLVGAVLTLALLQIRRYHPRIRGELGGPRGSKIATMAILFTIWFIYVLLSTLVAYCVIKGF